MLTILWFILATIGMTNIMVHGKFLDIIYVRPILKKILPSTLYAVFECYECMGFWCGIVCGIALVSYDPLVFILCGFAGSVVAQTYTEVMMWLRSNITFELINEDEEDD